jgi:tRNA(Ile)-lysidine synthase
VLRAEINPSVDVALAHAAEIARAEEHYWQEQTSRVLPLLIVPGEPARGGGRKNTSAQSVSLDIQKLEQHPIAVQRRVLRAAAEQLGCAPDFDHVHEVLEMLRLRSSRGARNRMVEIAEGWCARLLFRELRFERIHSRPPIDGYEHVLPLPGEITLPEFGVSIRARISEGNGNAQNPTYNLANSIRLPERPMQLLVRNWRAGDRFQPARHSSEKRLKELLYALHLPEEEKRLWPVVTVGEKIVWVRGVDSPELVLGESGQRLWIEECEQ